MTWYLFIKSFKVFWWICVRDFTSS